MPIIRLSCCLWTLFNFLWSLCDNPHVLQLYNRMLLTSVSYSRILDTFVFHFFFQTVSLFDIATFDNSFLLFISSLSPSFDSSLITFLHYASSTFAPLFIVVFSVFSSFASRLFSVNTFFAL